MNNIFYNSVLIVDDERDFRESIVCRVKKMVSNVYEAENGIHALEIINNNNIELVLTDLNMPKMNGMELLCEIRKNHRHIINIILTSFGDMESVKKALKLGAYDFLEKPVEIEYLMNCIKRSLEKVNYEKNKWLLLENLLFEYSSISPNKFRALSHKDKKEVLNGVFGLMKVRTLNKQYKKD